MMCNCNPNVHKVTNMTTAGLLTVTNPNNIANLDLFILIMCVNPSNIITGAPVNLTMTINGATVDLLNKYGLPISSDRLAPRRRYIGRYIVPATGTPYVILLDTPCNIAYALSSASVALASGSTDTTGDSTNSTNSTRSSK